MLKNGRIRLSPLLSDDVDSLFKWINDRELVLFNAPYKPVSFQAHKEWFENACRRKDAVIFGIRLAENDKLIGVCQLYDIHPVHRLAELQIRIGDKENRGKGYGLEAAGLLLKFAFDDLNLHRVWLRVFSSNTNAIRMYEKAGFIREGVLRQSAHIDGKGEDVVVMAILRNERAE